MEQCLKFMPTICTDGVKAERKLLDYIVYEVYGVLLSMAGVYLQCPDSSRIVDGGILEPADLLAIRVLERKEGYIYLDVVTGHLLRITFGVNGSTADVSR